jgi:hypothetical protein
MQRVVAFWSNVPALQGARWYAMGGLNSGVRGVKKSSSLEWVVLNGLNVLPTRHRTGKALTRPQRGGLLGLARRPLQLRFLRLYLI